jgi:hypothetical protein
MSKRRLELKESSGIRKLAKTKIERSSVTNAKGKLGPKTDVRCAQRKRSHQKELPRERDAKKVDIDNCFGKQLVTLRCYMLSLFLFYLLSTSWKRHVDPTCILSWILLKKMALQPSKLGF